MIAVVGLGSVAGRSGDHLTGSRVVVASAVRVAGAVTRPGHGVILIDLRAEQTVTPCLFVMFVHRRREHPADHTDHGVDHRQHDPD
jgi:hypothetical protein